MNRLFHLVICCLLFSCKSLPEQRPASVQFMRLATVSKSKSLPATADNDKVRSGIALVDSDQTCSGIVIGNAARPQSPAYLLTAGHCLIDIDDAASSNRVFRDALPRSDRNQIHFAKADFRIGRVLYATMKGIDIALTEITEQENAGGIFRLSERSEVDADDIPASIPAVSVQRLRELGIEPLHLAQQLPKFGDSVRIVSASHHDEGEHAKDSGEPWHEHVCQHEGLTDVVEGIWHWYDLARNNCEDILSGDSGAPVFNQQGEVFALVNTSSRNALSQDCYTGQPCEITEESFQVALARNYGSPLLDVKACLDPQGIFQLQDAHCPLEQLSAFRISNQSKTPVNPVYQAKDRRQWNVQLAEPKAYHYKQGQLPAINCRQPDQYSSLSADEGRLKALPLPTQSGLHALCLISDEAWQRHDLRHPTQLIVNIDDHPPVLKPRPVQNPATHEVLMAVRKSCQNLPAGATLDLRKKCAVAVISFEMQPFEVMDFRHGWIDAKDRDCSHIQGENLGAQVHIPVSALPANVCVWAIDGAGNRAEQPVIIAIRAPTRREIIEATDVMVDWSYLVP